jgi:type IV pilus assembly protein PilB
MARVPLGQLLKREGLVGDDQLVSALAHQRKWGCRIGQSLLRLRLVDPDQLLAVAARQVGLSAVHIGDRLVPDHVLRRLPERLIVRRRVFPLELLATARGPRLVVAFAAPDDLSVIDEVTFAAGVLVNPVLASEEDLERAIARHGLGGAPPRPDAIELPPPSDEPMQLVNGILLEA